MKFNLLIIIVFLGVLFFDQQGIEANSAPAPLVKHSKDAGQSCETVTKNQVIFFLNIIYFKIISLSY